MNVDLSSGLWRFHQVVEDQPTYQSFEPPAETGGSTTILFSLLPRKSGPPDRRFGSEGVWFEGKVAWAHSDPGQFWFQLFGPPKGLAEPWMLEVVQTGFADQNGSRSSEYLTLWTACLTGHPERGEVRTRFFGHGRRNAWGGGWDNGSGGRLSFSLTQQLKSDSPNVMNGWSDDWRYNTK